MTSVALTISIGLVRGARGDSIPARRGFIADQQDADTEFARGQDGAFDFGARRMVSAHSIESDGGHLYTDWPQENASSER